MNPPRQSNTVASILLLVIVLSVSVFAQRDRSSSGEAVMWERVNIRQRNLRLGPGGTKMSPNLRRITFIRKETGGNNLKYRIKDGSGRIWVAKIADESRPEVAAVRLLWGIGYSTEIDYLVPRLTIPGKGTFTNVRLEARPGNIDRLGNWSWDDNPFETTDEFHGLRIMMALINNWDLKDTNNVILKDGNKRRYAISDLGASFGKLAFSSKFLLNRIGRSVDDPVDYYNSRFIKGIEDGEIDFAYKGKRVGLMYGITPRHGLWLSRLLRQLSDRQIGDAFRAANYSPSEVKLLLEATKRRIQELDSVSRLGTTARIR